MTLRRSDVTLVPPPPGALGGPYVYCDQALRPHGIDTAAENAEAMVTARAVASGDRTRAPYHVLVVPGYTPLDQETPLPGVHPVARERLIAAIGDLRAGLAPLILVSGGNVHPEGTPYNEALEMKRFLLAQGVSASQVLIEPCARHSHTNLRNAGRLMIRTGLRSALIVTSWDQAMYFQRPRSSSFDARCLADIGYLVGELQGVDEHHVAFIPSGRTLESGRDSMDP